MPENALKETTTALLTAQETLVKFFVDYGFKLLGAAVILMAGVFLSRLVAKFMTERLAKVEIEPPIKLLMTRIVRVVIIGLTLMIAVQKLGVDIMPLIAGVGVAGVGIGLAMQGVLANAVAGLTIIFSKPFRVGEYISIHDVEGEVVTIELFSTTLTHPDKSRVIIPNRKIVGEILHNFGEIRQLNLTVGVAYSTDLNRAIAAIRKVLDANAKVLKDPVAVIGVTELADSSINIAVKPWVAVKDFGPTRALVFQTIVDEFRAQGISIPFPQREIRLMNPAA